MKLQSGWPPFRRLLTVLALATLGLILRERAGAQPLPGKTFVVNSAADTDDFNPNSGVMTLRKALRMADGTAAVDTIVFNIPGTTTIQVNGLLGSLGAVQPVIIDGTTQPGGRISIDGSQAGSFDPGGREISGFELVGMGSTLKGFSIHHFAFDGVLLRPSGAPFTGSNIVSGCLIHDNKRHGIHIIGSQDNLIGGTNDATGNRIYANRGDGIHIAGTNAPGNTVSRNTIGHLLSVQANGGDCIVIQDAPHTTIGTQSSAAGPAPPSGGNTLYTTNSGIRINGMAAEFCRIVDNDLGNFFGGKLTNGIIHRGGDFLSIEGNTFENVAGIAVDAEFAVGTKYSIKHNSFGVGAELAVRARVNGGLVVTIDVKDNDIVGSLRGMQLEETSGSGKVDWNVLDNTGQNGKSGIKVDFHAGGTKIIGATTPGHGSFSGYAEGALQINQVVPPGIPTELRLTGGVYDNSGGPGVAAAPGVRGVFQVNAAFPITITDLIASGNSGDGMSLAITPFLDAKTTITADRSTWDLDGGFALSIINGNGSNRIDLIKLFMGTDSLTRCRKGGLFLFGVDALRFSVDDCLIANHDGPGVTLAGGTQADVNRNLISGNPIGVLVQDTALGSLVGNAFTGNGTGVATEGKGVATIGPNSFSANTGLAIDLGNDGVTANDLSDTDGRQNFPVLTAAVAGATTTTIRGTLHSTPNQTFTLAFFASTRPHPSGHGEGERFLGSTTVRTDGSGNAGFAVALPVAVPAGQFISATATSSAGSTSEFSLALLLGAGLAADLAVSTTASSTAVPAGSNVTYTLVVKNNGPAAAANVVVTNNLPANTAFISATTTGGGVIGGTGNHRTVTFASLTNGATARITLVAKISAAATVGTVITKTASVTAAGATDPNSSNNSSTTTIRVSATNRPPVISHVMVCTPILWPPNHKLVPVTVNYTATDYSGVAPTCTLSVRSNEPLTGTGPGDLAPDWQILDAHHLKLRAERSPKGTGRVYTITITCRDRAGLSAQKTVTVQVPKHPQ